MSETVGVRDLRQNLSKYLARVKEGESLTVTERGEVVARLGPPDDGLSEHQRKLLRLFPGTKLAKGDLIEAIDSLPRGNPAPVGTTDAFLDESRKRY